MRGVGRELDVEQWCRWWVGTRCMGYGVRCGPWLVPVVWVRSPPLHCFPLYCHCVSTESTLSPLIPTVSPLSPPTVSTESPLYSHSGTTTSPTVQPQWHHYIPGGVIPGPVVLSLARWCHSWSRGVIPGLPPYQARPYSLEVCAVNGFVFTASLGSSSDQNAESSGNDLADLSKSGLR